ncbi:MAG: hypothetical protein AAB472_01645 [Patescibacteria group bacterium]
MSDEESKDPNLPESNPDFTETAAFKNQVARQNAKLAARMMLREIRAGRPSSGWKNTLHKDFEEAGKKTDTERSLRGIFEFDHPEWKNPFETGSNDYFRWEMKNLTSRMKAFKLWLNDRD